MNDVREKSAQQNALPGEQLLVDAARNDRPIAARENWRGWERRADC